MTITQFIEKLSATSGEWQLDGDGNLMDEDEQCPLWHVYCGSYIDREDEDQEPADDYVEAGRRCGLRTRDAVAIAQAANNRGHHKLRKRLLDAAGIALDSTPTTGG